MRIIELKSSPGVVRRAAPSPARTPALEEHEEFSRTSPPSSGAPMAAPAADNTLDSLDEDLVEPGYALPSACNKSSSSSAFRTSTPLDGKYVPHLFKLQSRFLLSHNQLYFDFVFPLCVPYASFNCKMESEA